MRHLPTPDPDCRQIVAFRRIMTKWRHKSVHPVSSVTNESSKLSSGAVMIQSSNNCRMLLAAMLAGIALPSTASATEDDLQLWTYFTAETEVAEGAVATLELSPRQREKDNLLQSRFLLDFDIAEGVTLGGAVTHVALDGSDEWRTHQELNIKRGPVSTRTRFEQRYYAGADRPQLRFRQRVQVAQPIAPRTALLGKFEFLYIVRDQFRGEDPYVDNLRFTVSAKRQLEDNLDLEAGYMLIYSPRPGEDRISHVPVITLSTEI